MTAPPPEPHRPPHPWLEPAGSAPATTGWSCSRPSLLFRAHVQTVTRDSSSVSWTQSRAPEEATVGARSLHWQGGVAAPTPDAGTPSWTRTHPPFPQAHKDTHLALQPNSRQADLYEYVQGPGILAWLPHSIRSIIGGGCATALPKKLGVRRERSKFSAQLSRGPWVRHRCQHCHLDLTPTGGQCGSAESWGAQVPAGPIGVRIGQRGPSLQLPWAAAAAAPSSSTQ